MVIYHNLSELGNNTLQLGDIIILKGIEYKVGCNCLINISHPGDYNYKIFTELHLNKKEFCDKYYGYSSGDGDWPVYNLEDFKAATRVVKALFEIIETPSKDLDLKVGMYVKLKSKEQCKKEGIEIPPACVDFCGTTQCIADLLPNNKITFIKHGNCEYWIPISMIENITTNPFNIGDTVKVKSYEYAESINKTACLGPERFGSIHKIIEVSNNSPNTLFYKLDNNRYYYPEVLELYTEQEKEEPKFKVGDVVRVKSLDWYNANKNNLGEVIPKKGATFIDSMAQYCDKITTIKRINSNGDCILEDCDIYCFAPDSIEKVEDIPVTAPIIPNYDEIRSKAIRRCVPKLEDFDKTESNKIDCSSEFKFTVNKPKKVFF